VIGGYAVSNVEATDRQRRIGRHGGNPAGRPTSPDHFRGEDADADAGVHQ
jgi:hypothetical protein